MKISLLALVNHFSQFGDISVKTSKKEKDSYLIVVGYSSENTMYWNKKTFETNLESSWCRKIMNKLINDCSEKRLKKQKIPIAHTLDLFCEKEYNKDKGIEDTPWV